MTKEQVIEKINSFRAYASDKNIILNEAIFDVEYADQKICSNFEIIEHEDDISDEWSEVFNPNGGSGLIFYDSENDYVKVLLSERILKYI